MTEHERYAAKLAARLIAGVCAYIAGVVFSMSISMTAFALFNLTVAALAIIITMGVSSHDQD